MLQRGVELHHLLGQQDGKVCVLVGGMKLESLRLHQPAVGFQSMLAALMWLLLPGGRGLAAAGRLGLPPAASAGARPLLSPGFPAGAASLRILGHGFSRRGQVRKFW